MTETCFEWELACEAGLIWIFSLFLKFSTLVDDSYFRLNLNLFFSLIGLRMHFLVKLIIGSVYGLILVPLTEYFYSNDCLQGDAASVIYFFHEPAR